MGVLPNCPVSETSEPRIPITTRFFYSLKFGVVRKLLTVWIITIAVAGIILFTLQNQVLRPETSVIELWTVRFFMLALIALVCEYVDSTLGMGYGTTLTPLLLILPFGLDPLTIVPAVLISELFTGIAGGISHNEAGNLNLKPGTMDFKIAMTLAVCSMVGAVLAVIIAVNIDKTTLKLVIGGIVLAVGIVLVATKGAKFRFSWKKILALGLIASFNKALSGGGYGPVVMGGQLVSGVKGKSAIGITSLAEGLTCLVGVILFVIAGKITDLSLALPLTLGAVCSIPFSAYTVRQMHQKWLVTAIAVLTIVLGTWTILKTLYLS